jgi:hypothetical protein
MDFGGVPQTRFNYIRAHYQISCKSYTNANNIVLNDPCRLPIGLTSIQLLRQVQV